MMIGTLGAGNGAFKFKYVRCFGGEVRAKLFIDGYRWSNSESASITAHIDLDEGASCATDDLDGQSEFVTRPVKVRATPGPSMSRSRTTKRTPTMRARPSLKIRALPL